jgi:PAS domain S-box-containing protein
VSGSTLSGAALALHPERAILCAMTDGKAERSRDAPPERDDDATSADDDRFRALADHATELVAEFDSLGRYLYASPSFRTLLGIDPASLVGHTPGDLIHPEDEPNSTVRFNGALDNLAESHSIHRLRHADGSWRWFDNSGRAYRTIDGEIRFVSLGRDITQQRQSEQILSRRVEAEQALLELSRRLLSMDARQLHATLAESLSVACSLAAADRAFLVARRDSPEAGSDLYRWPEDQVPPPVLARLPWLDEQIRAGRLVECERLSELPHEARADCSELEARGVQSLLGIPLRAGSSQLGMLVFEATEASHAWTIEDVTLLSLCADVFASSIDRLRRETALDDSRIQLIQAQKMEAVGRVAGGIAHDFNNLLMVIGGFSASLAEELPDDHPGHGDAAEIEQAVAKASKLTEQLLTLSRRQVVSTQRVDLNDTLEGLREIISRLLGEDLTLRLEIDARLGPVQVDTGQFEQAVVNLAMNARNAMESGGTLIISTRARSIDAAEAERVGLPGPGDFAVLTVRDDGCGMDEATQARVFEPFFTTREPGQGTGLGLSIVYGLIRQWNGAITLWSRPGRGTRLEIYLPRVEGEPETADARPTVQAARGSETILLAEDEAPVRKLLTRVLAQAGYEVLAARDGVDALQLANAHDGPIHALVTDVVMPRMGGVALARRLRGLHPALAVLFVSGHPLERTAEHTRSVVLGNFLQKPCSPRDLLAKLRTTLDAAEGR